MGHPMSEMKSHKDVSVMPAPAYLVKYTDGNGKTEVKIAFIVGDDIRFLSDGGLSKPAQSWLKSDILVALGLKPEEERKPQVVETPIPSGLDGTEQV